jgi:ABC-type multidrug transport system permease subunit
VTEFAADTTGWLGALSLLSAYALVSSGRLSGSGLRFQLLNVAGALGLLLNSMYHGAWPSVGLNVVWLVLACLALIRLGSARVPPPAP